MSLELRRAHELSAAYAEPFRELVSANSKRLTARYFLQLVAKYSDDAAAAARAWEHTMQSDERATPQSGVTSFAVIDSEQTALEGLAGALTLYRGLQLRRQHLAVRPALAPWPVSTRVRLGPPATNISAWVHISDGPTITDVQRLSGVYIAGLSQMEIGELPWTVEPANDLSAFALTALEGASFRIPYGRPGRYDVGETDQVVPPESVLFVHDRIT